MLRLGFEGVVLRTHGSLVVVTIERPEFRIAGKITAAARQEIAAMANGIDAPIPV
jgi:ribosomal protein L32E